MAATDDEGLPERRSIQSLQREYEAGNRRPLEDVMRAWKGIQELPPDDPWSFLLIGGYHGEPFQYRKAVDALEWTDTYQYWGGYCNHGNVLFPTWHRVYVWWIEQALQRIVPGVMQPYWDETADHPDGEAVPWAFTIDTFELDGVEVPNPLKSFTLPIALSDDVPSDHRDYEKPAGYRTVRFPLSGLVGSPEVRAATERHNREYDGEHGRAKANAELNRNVDAWLRGLDPTAEHPTPAPPGVRDRYRMALGADSYTAFSNTTSMTQWNLDHPDRPVVALESPHNDIHLAVGGFDAPAIQVGESGIIAGANGDMGENNTAALDPIFFFHHCFVDYVFWRWQELHGATTELGIEHGYAGTDNAADGQGPTPGLPPGTRLTMDTPLNPFVFDSTGRMFTSTDCIDVRRLGFRYEEGSLSTLGLEDVGLDATRQLHVHGIDRADFQGSFMITAVALLQRDDATGAPSGPEEEVYLGHHAVLSRRNVVKCANCLTHLEVEAFFPLVGLSDAEIDRAHFRVDVQHRGPQPIDLQVECDVIG